MATRPTPETPYVQQDDGSGWWLVYAGRTNRLVVTHAGLTDPTGWDARLGLKTAFEAAGVDDGLLLTATVDDGDITLAALPDSAGTQITVVLTDEATEALQDVSGGRFDLVIESPGGEEIPVLVGKFTTYKRVTP